MSSFFDFVHTVSDTEIDTLGHANNVVYIEWMQSAALAHSAALGWPTERYLQLGSGWVVRRHEINYLRPVQRGEQIIVRTWVAEMKKVTSTRRYRIICPSDDALLATAETKWAFIDYSTGQPTRVPLEVAGCFDEVDL
jgi:acyl-CoA thioester hydrolase